MTADEAVRFCASIECKYCPIYIYDIEKRSRYEKEMLHTPCCENLVSHPDWREDE